MYPPTDSIVKEVPKGGITSHSGFHISEGTTIIVS